MHVASLGENLSVPFGAKRHAHAGIETRLIYGIREAALGINEREGARRRMGVTTPGCRREIFVHVIKAAAADGIKVKVTLWRQVYNRIDGGGENVDAAAWVTRCCLTWLS